MASFKQTNFLDQFDQPIKKYIVEYCKIISEKKYDVYILLARKAACFLTTLEDLEFVSFNGIVVSDRILEYDTKWLEGKNVAIIDDTIISGTSICKIIKKLKSINVASIHVHAFCINEYWYSEDMLRDGDMEYLTPPYMRVNHTSSIRFCKQIVDALSIVPRPYNIDFPVYEMGKLSRRNYSILIEDDNWKTINTATTLQEEYNVGCASFNFKRRLLGQFNESLGCDLTKVLFVKLRLFTKELIDIDPNQSKYQCRVVPYVIFNPIKSELALDILNAICSCENVPSEKLFSELKTDSAKLLFIQYYFAARLVKWWIGYVGKLLKKDFELKENKRSMFLLFPPAIVELIKGFSYKNKLSISSSTFDNAVLCNEYPLADKLTPVNPLLIKAKLTGLFLDLYYKKELAARKTVKRIGKKAFEDESYKKIINRLEDGISLDDLKKQVSTSVDNATDRNLILSTFLDNAIDRGIIVPITSNIDGFVYRGFRHGEEVIWGDANDKLMAVFFKSIYGKNEVVPKLLFEKLLVLFLKIGLKQKFLSEYDQTTPPSQKMILMGVRSYIHGQVAVYKEIESGVEVEFEQILKTNSNAYWTTRRLCDLKLLNLVKNKGDESEYNINFDKLFNKHEIDPLTKEDMDLDPGDINKVKNLAEIIKICIEKKWIKNPDGFVMLTSCMSLHDNTSSVGAELQVYCDCFTSYCNEIIGAVRDDTFSESSITFLKNARLFKAVNSGFMKYHRFRNNDGVELVKNIKERLASVNPFAARQWDEYWRKDIELLQAQDPELTALNNRMGLTIIDITVSWECLFLLLLETIRRNGVHPSKKDNPHTTKDEKELKKSIKQRNELVQKSLFSIKNKLSVLTKEEASSLLCSNYCRVILEETYMSFNGRRLYDEFKKVMKTLKELKTISEDCLLEFNSLVPKWGKIRNPKRYLSFLHLNTKTNNYDSRDKIGKIIKAELASFEVDEYNETKSDKSIVILRVDEIKMGGKGYVLGAKGVRHDEKLLRFACRLLRRCKELKEQIVITYCPNYFEDGIKAWYNPQTKLYDSIKEDLYQLMPYNPNEDCISVFINKGKHPSDYMLKMLKKYDLQQMFELCPIHSDNNFKFRINMKPRKKIFISFSRKDVGFKDELKKHLSVLNQFEIVDTWSCEEINIGSWDEQIKERLENSDLIIYMLSANFFSSNYILEQEVQNILSNGFKKHILCVLVSAICNQDKLSDYITNSLSGISDKQKAILALQKFQYLPYGKVWNDVSKQNEEKIIPLKEYANKTNSSIEEAFSQIIDKIVDLFRNFD